MARALRVMTRDVGLSLLRALSMATSIPAGVAGIGDTHGVLHAGRTADFVHLDARLHLAGVWRGGAPVALSPGAGAGA